MIEFSRPGVPRQRRRSLRLSLLVAGLGALLLAPLSAGAGTVPAPGTARGDVGARRAQTLPGTNAEDGPVKVTSITPWVDSEGEFQLRFRVDPSIPADAKLSYTIHQPLRATGNRTLHEVLDDVIRGGSPGKVLQAPVTLPLGDFGGDDGGYVLSIPVRSRSSADRTRVFLPLAGIHPVSVVLTSADGPEIWSTVLFLNHLPRDPDPGATPPGPVDVALVVPVAVPPPLISGTPRFSEPAVAQLTALGELLNSTPSAPLDVVLRGDVIAALGQMDSKWARDTVAALTTRFAAAAGDPAGSTTEPPDTTVPAAASAQRGPVLLAAPLTAVDTESVVRAGGTDVLRQQLDLGASQASRLSARPLLNSLWAPDGHLGPVSAATIESFGFTEVILSAAQVGPDDKDRRPVALGRVVPARVSGTERLRALFYDESLSTHLVDATLAPELRAHDVLTSLLADWYDNRSLRDPVAHPGTALLVPPTTPPAAVEALAAALGGNGPLRAAATGADGSGTALPARTVALRPPNVAEGTAALLDALRATGNQISSFAAAAPAEPLLDAWRLRNMETLDAGLGATAALRTQRDIRTQINQRVTQIVPPSPRRVVLASRDTTIPLRFKNKLPYEVELTLHARSPRITTPGGNEITLTLQPGENRVDLPVVVRAPGESLLRLRLTTPDGGIDVAAFDIPVQSTAISGVGAALSVISVLFLLAWWIGTYRRQRRDRARQDSSHPSLTGEDH